MTKLRAFLISFAITLIGGLWIAAWIFLGAWFAGDDGSILWALISGAVGSGLLLGFAIFADQAEESL